MKGCSVPKLTLTYNLPEEQEEYDIARKGIDLSIAIDEFSNWLRRKYKHVDVPSKEADAEYEEIVQKFFEVMNEYKVFED